MTELAADLRLAFRVLRRNRTLAVSVVTTLALAIGAGVATFAIAEAALITPPPFPQPDRLAMLYTTHTAPARGTERYRWSYQRFRMLAASRSPPYRDRQLRPRSVNLAGADGRRAHSFRGRRRRLLRHARRSPARGSLFSADEDRSPSASVVVCSATTSGSGATAATSTSLARPCA